MRSGVIKRAGSELGAVLVAVVFLLLQPLAE
jgi:hypothetical protein